MGFWQALDAGLTARIEEQTRQKERQQEIDLRTAERDELRAYEEKQAAKRHLFEMTQATMPLIVKRRQEEETLAAQRAQLGGFFEERLTDLPGETREAFTNLAVQDPTYSETLVGEVKKVETELGRRVTGPEILRMTGLIEKTKPEEMSLEEWTKQAASMTVTSGSNIDFEETLANLWSGNATMEDIQRTQMELMMPLGGSLNILPDIDTSVVMGPDPQTTTQLRSLAVSTMQDQFQADLAATERQYATETGGGGMPSEALETKYRELGRISALPEAEKEAALFNYYAPTLLPRLAEREPRFRTVFPEYFNTNTTTNTQDLTDAERRYLGMN